MKKSKASKRPAVTQPTKKVTPNFWPGKEPQNKKSVYLRVEGLRNGTVMICAQLPPDLAQWVEDHSSHFEVELSSFVRGLLELERYRQEKLCPPLL